MKCYRCNGTLDLMRETCPKCGADIRFFKKIVYMSNRYYNDGLAKAQARDLTGAKESLKTSLSLYKQNTHARNLLGLVYYATGESAEALKMWVISKNYAPEKNMCDRYINYLRRNMNSLDSEDRGIKRFNQALNYAGNNARDLAVIQLKKVISVHPNMTKAYELLALIYIDDGKYEQARKILNDCLKVDHGNTKALYYLKELDSMTQGSARSVGVVGDEDREQVIIPVRFRDFGSYLANAMYILTGVLLGIAIAWFVIVPGKLDKEMEGASKEARSYEVVIDGLQKQIADRSREESEAARNEYEDASRSEEASIEESIRESEEQASRDALLESMPLLNKLVGFARNNEAVVVDGSINNAEDRARFIRTFFTIDPNELSDANLVLYDVIAKVLCHQPNRESYIAEAEAWLAGGDASKAADVMDAMTYLMPENADVRIRAAQLYEAAGDKDKAANFYWQYYWLFGDREDHNEAGERYKILKGKTTIDPWPESIDPAKITRPVVYEELMAGLNIPETTPAPVTETEPQPETEPEQEPDLGNTD